MNARSEESTVVHSGLLPEDPDARDMENCPVVDLSLVVPVFDEEKTVRLFSDRITEVFEQDPSVRLELVFVNDGSTDNTLGSLIELQELGRRVRIVDLSRNFGKEAALTAGLEAAKGRIVVPIDVDLQDPPEIIRDMIARWREGYDVVLGRRVSRESDSWSKRISAKLFYRLHNRVADQEIPENVGDFRLLDRAVVDVINELPESRRFMKGLFAWVGFKTTSVGYVREVRSAGSSKFNGWRLWNFALEGLTSFSTVPLRIWSYIGMSVAMLSFLYGLYIMLRVAIEGIDVPGYASIFVAITFLGGLQLLGIGVVGEYLGRVYVEAKRRPVYLIRRIYEPRE